MLGKAVHSLSRIGDELYLEPLEDGVRGWVWGGRVGLQPGAGNPDSSLAPTRLDDRWQICRQFQFLSLAPVIFPGRCVN